MFLLKKFLPTKTYAVQSIFIVPSNRPMTQKIYRNTFSQNKIPFLSKLFLAKIKLFKIRPWLRPIQFLSTCENWNTQRRPLTLGRLKSEEYEILDEIEIRTLKQEDRDSLRRFLRLYNYVYEQFAIGLRPKLPDQKDEDYKLCLIDYGLSLVAVQKVESSEQSRIRPFCCDGTERIVGAVLSYPKTPYDALVLLEEAKQLGPTKRSENIRFMASVERDSCVCKRYGVSCALHTEALSVIESMRGRGLGERLMVEQFLHAQKNGFPLVSYNCTCAAAEHVCKNVEMETVSKVYYTDYKNEFGEQIFKVPSSYDAVKTFAKWVW